MEATGGNCLRPLHLNIYKYSNSYYHLLIGQLIMIFKAIGAIIFIMTLIPWIFRGLSVHLWSNHLRGAWVAQTVECLTFDFGSSWSWGHDIKPVVGVCAGHGVYWRYSFSLSLPPTLAQGCSPSLSLKKQKNKNAKNIWEKRKKKKQSIISTMTLQN